MSTYFISDLHLCEQQPLITKRFIQFCQNQARDARALYILGDFFEYWLGDDALDKTAMAAQKALKALSEHGTEVYFMAGNRDFLLGQAFAESCGMTILNEPHTIELNGVQVLLVHGDAECTDDMAYQKVRGMFRDPQWQQNFLKMPIAQRIEFAQKAREQSQQHTQMAMSETNEIMDVNTQAIEDLFIKHPVKTLIHGHTHRPAIHKHGENTRIVLGDWHHQISYLKVQEDDFQLVGH
ncbi:UDP-2,3-diacylglucosamine diphosphatase [Marinicella sp. S1101]|uniref:UDP-2,3-diacylglucosamine diphosphatase n=1 Tax=Marinicella marina TaxID=2996016 RepID=UPI002260CA03|nr:UDP-2,3-diacylglucosamine diphosphatase [Marinicella marina]MCX7554171.1 UDP-2,3-diacylglucosamine diphosphatase [Marinicella marina]MDJ1141136.1 UDP-2,3-diacylglucosamine diphosphatase [Marinicella marina]